MSPAAGRPGISRAVKDGLGRLAPVVRWLMIACVVVWLAELLTWEAWQPAWRLLLLDPSAVLGRGFVWQLLTYQFLHDPASPFHLAWNMYALWLFGQWLAPRWGTWSFLLFYLTCGAGGGLLHALLALAGVQGAEAPVVGASGALLGLFTAAAVIWPHRQILFMLFIPLELRFAALFTALFTILIAWRPGSGIANFAHLGGMATGWLYLKWGWKATRLAASPWARLVGWVREKRRRFQRRKFQVVDRDFDEWLRSEMDQDETKH